MDKAILNLSRQNNQVIQYSYVKHKYLLLTLVHLKLITNEGKIFPQEYFIHVYNYFYLKISAILKIPQVMKTPKTSQPPWAYLSHGPGLDESWKKHEDVKTLKKPKIQLFKVVCFAVQLSLLDYTALEIRAPCRVIIGVSDIIG